MRRITLLTDFGTADGYPAALKGVVASIRPSVLVEDVSHSVPAGDVAAAAWALRRYWSLYPPGTVHVVVVDPGVGGSRRALAASADERILVAPDNGVVTWPLELASSWRAVSLERTRFHRDEVSATFHGRDIFAPAAAHLAGGASLDDLGPALEDPVRIPLPRPTRDPGVVRGEVVHVDSFGNLTTNVPAEWVASAVEVMVGGRALGPVRRSYTDVGPGDPLALIGSEGLLELAVREGRADRALGTGIGGKVEVRLS